jgi:hypothetical protein
MYQEIRARGVVIRLFLPSDANDERLPAQGVGRRVRETRLCGSKLLLVNTRSDVVIASLIDSLIPSLSIVLGSEVDSQKVREEGKTVE